MGRIFMSTEITVRKKKLQKVFAQEKRGILVVCFVEIILLFIQVYLCILCNKIISRLVCDTISLKMNVKDFGY